MKMKALLLLKVKFMRKQKNIQKVIHQTLAMTTYPLNRKE